MKLKQKKHFVKRAYKRHNETILPIRKRSLFDDRSFVDMGNKVVYWYNTVDKSTRMVSDERGKG